MLQSTCIPAAALIVACNATAPQSPPSHSLNETEHTQITRDASAPKWVEVNCSTILSSRDVTGICNPVRTLPDLIPDRSEGTIHPPLDLNPATRVTCARSLKLDGNGVLVHFDVLDYSTPDALAKITEIWQRSFPRDFQDGLRIHEVKQDWIRCDVDGGKGRLSISAFEADQPNHPALCSSESLIKIVRPMQSRLPSGE